MQNTVLQKFQEFLSASNIVQKKYISYYAYWSSKFLSFSNKHTDLNHDLQVQKFLDQLQSHDNVADWQIRQAHDAIRLYFNHFKDGSFVNSNQGDMKEKYSPDDLNNLIDKMREAIRIRHYSYRTEQTYIDWLKRFMDYIKKIKEPGFFGLDSDDVRNYLSYLALQKKVSASTQNQALL